MIILFSNSVRYGLRMLTTHTHTHTHTHHRMTITGFTHYSTNNVNMQSAATSNTLIIHN